MEILRQRRWRGLSCLQGLVRPLVLFAPLLAAACATPTLETPELPSEEVRAEASQQRSAYVRALLKEQERLARISYKLSIHAVPLCGDRTTYTTGAFFFDWDQTQDEWVDAANEAVGINLHAPGIEVLIVVPGSPAEKAGFQVGDRVMRLDTWRVPTGRGAFTEFRYRVGKSFADGAKEIEFRVLRGAEFHTIRLTPIRACNYPVFIEERNEINAYTDGRKIVVFRGMIRFVRDDDELAGVIAHELSHVVLGHIDAKIQNALTGAFVGVVVDVLVAATTGVRTNVGQIVGANIGLLAYSKEFEAEADYMSAYMLAQAGYDFTKLPGLFRYLSTLDPETIDYGLTHPTSPKRVVSLEKVVKEIQEKKNQGLPLAPERKVRVR